jgi:hypothetical protein
LMRNAYPEGYNCHRSRLNWTLLISVVGRIKENLSDDEQIVLFGVPWAQIDSIGGWPRGFPSVAYELGRLVDEDPEYAVECLRAVVDARRRGICWRGCRAHVRNMRLGRREGNAVALTVALSRAVDAYQTQYPATTRQQIEAAVEMLLVAVRMPDNAEAPP